MKKPLTSEEMVIEAPSIHKFIYKQAVFPFGTKTNEFNKIGMVKLPEKAYLGLHYFKEEVLRFCNIRAMRKVLYKNADR